MVWYRLHAGDPRRGEAAQGGRRPREDHAALRAGRGRHCQQEDQRRHRFHASHHHGHLWQAQGQEAGEEERRQRCSRRGLDR